MNQQAINWDEFKCRCSGITLMMSNSRSNPVLTELQAVKMKELEDKGDKITEKQKLELAELHVKRENGKKIILSDTCIEMLMNHYSWVTVKKVDVDKEMMEIMYVEKGKMVEENSITLKSRVESIFYLKNNEGRISNEYLTGIPDIFVSPTGNIMESTKISDIKSLWSYPGFLKSLHVPIKPAWDSQVKGYCDISGATEGEISHCLVNTPLAIVEDQKRRLLRKMDVVTDEAPEFKEAAEILERSMFFEDIPMHKRVYNVPVTPFTEQEKQAVYDKVKICREWLWKFDEMYENFNK